MSDVLSRHRWTREEDIVAFYLSRYGDRHLPVQGAAIASKLGLKESSLIMRIENFHFLEGKGGLRNAAAQSRWVFEEYQAVPEPDVRQRVIRILGNVARNGRGA